jgi:hypothetical protein
MVPVHDRMPVILRPLARPRGRPNRPSTCFARSPPTRGRSSRSRRASATSATTSRVAEHRRISVANRIYDQTAKASSDLILQLTLGKAGCWSRCDQSGPTLRDAVIEMLDFKAVLLLVALERHERVEHIAVRAHGRSHNVDCGLHRLRDRPTHCRSKGLTSLSHAFLTTLVRFYPPFERISFSASIM